MANMIINISTAHPVLAITVVLGFIATCLTYIATDFVSDNMVISGDLTAGTFLGTFTHMNWGHYLGNMLFLIPVWIYADNKVGKVFVVSIVLANMTITAPCPTAARSGRDACGRPRLLSPRSRIRPTRRTASRRARRQAPCHPSRATSRCSISVSPLRAPASHSQPTPRMQRPSSHTGCRATSTPRRTSCPLRSTRRPATTCRRCRRTSACRPCRRRKGPR